MVHVNRSANETTARAYSHQGHGPRADKQAGYILATSDIQQSSLLQTAVGPYIGSEADVWVFGVLIRVLGGERTPG